jgi:hypothetical protein
VQKSEHKWRQEEEAYLLKKIEAKEELRGVECVGVLNMQLLVVKLPPHSPSSLKCKEDKTYNEKMQFAEMIIHDIYINGTFVMQFLCRHIKS